MRTQYQKLTNANAAYARTCDLRQVRPQLTEKYIFGSKSFDLAIKLHTGIGFTDSASPALHMLKGNICLTICFLIRLGNNIIDMCLQPRNLPMRRHVPKPFDAGRFELRMRLKASGTGGLGWETTGDSMRNQRGAFLFQPLNQCPLLRYQRIDFLCLTVEESGDGALFGEGWCWDSDLPKVVLAQIWLTPSC